MSGFIYFIENPAMPGLIKIGFTTTTLEQRLLELNTTGVPTEFTISAAFRVRDPKSLEHIIHKGLDEFRLKQNREFFKISAKLALEKTIQLIITEIDSDSFSPHQTSGDLLDEIEIEILRKVITSNGGEVFPQRLAWDLHIHKEEAHFKLDELVSKGYLRDDREAFSLTAKGRRYCIQAGFLRKDDIDY